MPAYAVRSQDLHRLLPLLAIPITLKLDGVPGCQPPTFVCDALDSPWVEPRVEVLDVAVLIVVGHFQMIVCKVPTLTIRTESLPGLRARCAVELIS